ncbi:lysophosphatidic acid receptor 5b [Clinocottus analis]|uniref:lysophosphatidic acid receptor 5b n=1 Tax=Clinocottus analis TaxID=304258 RepID=UPI0035C0F8DB
MLDGASENATRPSAGSAGYAAAFGSVMALGLPLNAVSLWILLTRKSLKSRSVVFMVNLAVSDLMLVVALSPRVYFYAAGAWPLGDTACIWFMMLFRNNIRSSSIFITFISADRLMAVVYPLRSRHLRTASNAWKAVALVWVFVLAVNIPESVELSRFLQNSSESSCFEYLKDPPSLMRYVQPVLVLAMLAVNVASTALVSRALRTRPDDSARVKNKVNVMLIFAMNLAMFVVFFVPVSTFVFFQSEGASRTPLICLASVNCCVDPLLYYFSFDGFWKRKEDVDNSGTRES